jgi:hypothetical protein
MANFMGEAESKCNSVFPGLEDLADGEETFFGYQGLPGVTSGYQWLPTLTDA